MTAVRRLVLFVCVSSAWFFASVTPASGGAIRDAVGSAHWGGKYWFPSTLQWCLDSLNQPYLVSTPCVADQTTPVDELSEGANRLLAMGSRVIYIPLNPNPRAWFGV
jgi:hypothetical protein